MPAVMIKYTQFGKQAHPVEKGEAEKLVVEGKAFRHNSTLFEMHKDTTYQTKVMTPEAPVKNEPEPTPTPKAEPDSEEEKPKYKPRRGRPRKTEG